MSDSVVHIMQLFIFPCLTGGFLSHRFGVLGLMPKRVFSEVVKLGAVFHTCSVLNQIKCQFIKWARI